jgi:hypothetical protein
VTARLRIELLEARELLSGGTVNPFGAVPAPVVSRGNFTPTLIIGNSTADKHASGTRDAEFTLLMSNPSAQTVTANYSTVDGTATAADHDYIPLSGSVTFAPGETQKTVTVQIVGDTILEPDETFWVVLSNVVNAVPVRPQGLGTILNTFDFNEGLWSAGTFQFTGKSLVVPGSLGTATVNVVRVGGSTGATSVTFSTLLGGNAVPGVNYVPTTATLYFADGETSKTVTVPIFDNGPPVGGASAVILALSNPGGGASLGPMLSTAGLVIVSSPKAAVAVQSVTTVTDRKRNVSQLVLNLGGDVNAAQAQSVASYRLATAGRSGSFDAPDAGVIPITSAFYNAATHQVTLTVGRPFLLTRPALLRVSGLTDAYGRPVTNAATLITHNGVNVSSLQVAKAVATPGRSRFHF